MRKNFFISRIICYLGVMTLLITWCFQSWAQPSKSQGQSQSTSNAPPLPNGVTFGGLGIGIADLRRTQNVTKVWIAFRRIDKIWSPREFTLIITDDRGNGYGEYLGLVGTGVFGLEGTPPDCEELPIGFTWVSEVKVKMPEIAPIAKIELKREKRFDRREPPRAMPERLQLDFRRVHFPDLDFNIKPEHLLTGKELKISRDISMWLGEPKISEEAQQDARQITVSIPITAKNVDYNPHSALTFFFFLQLNSGRVIPIYHTGTAYPPYSKEIQPQSTETFEYSHRVRIDKEEKGQIVLTYTYSMPYLKFYGLIPIPARSDIEKAEKSPNIAFKLRGKIAFASNRQGNKEIYVKDLGTGKQINLTKHPANDWNPVWSPDGSRIAFVSDRDSGTRKIYIMDSDGKNLRQIAKGEDPQWFPKGTQIAFGRSRPAKEYGGPGGQIFVIDIEGKNSKRVADHTGFWSGGPTVSPNGEQIAYMLGAGVRGKIRIINTQGKTLYELDTSKMMVSPSFSPDGNKIATSYPPDDGIAIVDLKDGSVNKINAFGRRPSWSRDGNWIIFDGGGDVYIIRRDGTSIRKIIERDNFINFDASWSD